MATETPPVSTNVISSLFSSEKFVVCFVLIVAASVMLAMGKITPDQWMTFAKVMGGIYVAGKTVQGSVSLFAPKDGAGGDDATSKLITLLPLITKLMTPAAPEAPAKVARASKGKGASADAVTVAATAAGEAAAPATDPAAPVAPPATNG